MILFFMHYVTGKFQKSKWLKSVYKSKSIKLEETLNLMICGFSVFRLIKGGNDRIPEYAPGIKAPNLLLSCALRLVWVDAACIFVLGGGSVAEENLEHNLINSWVMLIRSTAHLSYCPSAILHIRPTATSNIRQLFIFVLFEG